MSNAAAEFAEARFSWGDFSVKFPRLTFHGQVETRPRRVPFGENKGKFRST